MKKMPLPKERHSYYNNKLTTDLFEIVTYAKGITHILNVQTQQLPFGTGKVTLIFAGQVDTFEGYSKIIANVVANAEIELRVLFRMLRLIGSRCRSDQEGITPVVGQAGGPLVIFVDQDEVGGVAQARQSELSDCRITGDIVFDIAVNNRVVRLHAEAG